MKMPSRRIRRAAERQNQKDARKLVNQQNAQLSTGPKTEAGKAASSRNAVKHGLYCKGVVSNPEDRAQLAELKDALAQEHLPQIKPKRCSSIN